MSCYDNDCGQATPSTNNPCDYDNCGCLNPSTFNCTTYTGEDLDGTGIEKDDKGDEILKKIDDSIVELQGDSGKILVDGNDTCPEFLEDKIEAGLNIELEVVGTGCDKKLRINATEGGVPVDVSVKVSSADTTAGKLTDKIDTGAAISKTIMNPGANEKIKLDIVMAEMVSADSGNLLTVGSDDKLKTAFTTPDGSETKVIEGTGVTVTGSGTIGDPYTISTNPSIQFLRPCFDNTWRDITNASITNPSVTKVSGGAKYRYRHDGTVEFKGSITFSVQFGNYSSASRKHTVTIGSIPTTCLTAAEQIGTADLKGMNYIDVPQASADQITQQYGYIIRKSAQNLIMEFQSSFTNATTKIIVVNFDGAMSHPTI